MASLPPTASARSRIRKRNLRPLRQTCGFHVLSQFITGALKSVPSDTYVEACEHFYGYVPRMYRCKERREKRQRRRSAVTRVGTMTRRIAISISQTQYTGCENDGSFLIGKLSKA